MFEVYRRRTDWRPASEFVMPGFVPGIYVSTVRQQGKTSVAGMSERNQRRPLDGYARS